VSVSVGSRDLKYGDSELDGIRGNLDSEDSKLDNDEDPVKEMRRLED
jgi:hypothetical protein